jgi:F420-non-reducing hydrogenase iron-sulfur subunit
MNDRFTINLTVFHCINLFQNGDAILSAEEKNAALKFVKMPCSSMVKDVFVLRAFEAGADAVAVMVCPEGACRYVEGNLRARKRVDWVKALLDEIGIGGRRLSFFNVPAGDQAAAERAMHEALSQVDDLGPNPAKYKNGDNT